jgi:hypothetical protein
VVISLNSFGTPTYPPFAKKQKYDRGYIIFVQYNKTYRDLKENKRKTTAFNVPDVGAGCVGLVGKLLPTRFGSKLSTPPMSI